MLTNELKATALNSPQTVDLLQSVEQLTAATDKAISKQLKATLKEWLNVYDDNYSKIKRCVGLATRILALASATWPVKATKELISPVSDTEIETILLQHVFEAHILMYVTHMVYILTESDMYFKADQEERIRLMNILIALLSFLKES